MGHLRPRPYRPGRASARTFSTNSQLRTLGDVRRRTRPDDPQLVAALSQYGLTLHLLGSHADAGPLLRESLTIREKTQPDAWATFNTRSMLGGTLLGQKKYADAAPLLVSGYEGMKAREKSIPPQGRTRIPESLDRLIELAVATNKPDEAAKWRAERAKYPFVAPMPRPAK